MELSTWPWHHKAHSSSPGCRAPPGKRLRQRRERPCEETDIKSEELVGQFKTFRALALPKCPRGVLTAPKESWTSSAAKRPAGLGSAPPPRAGALGCQQEPLGTSYPEHLLECHWDLPGSYPLNKKYWEEPSPPYKF